MLTLVFLSFHSEHHIRRLVNSIDEKYDIIIIENSSNLNLKKEIESKHKNVNVVVCEENLGFSKGMNLGIKLSKTPYVFLNPSDIEISNESLNKLCGIIKKYNNFGMLSPVYADKSIHSNFFISNKKNSRIIVETEYGKFPLDEVDIIDGTIILNKNIIKKDYFDENFFIYFETFDLSKRLVNKNIKLYVCKEITFNHYGGQSHNKKYNFEAQLSRNWHYNWSKFYYFKKHKSFLYGLRKILPNFLRAVKKYVITLSQFNKSDFHEKRKLCEAEIKGIMSSIFLRPSNYRPYKKNNT